MWLGEGVQYLFLTRSQYACFQLSLRRKHHTLTSAPATLVSPLLGGEAAALGSAGDGSSAWWHDGWGVGVLMRHQWGGRTSAQRNAVDRTPGDAAACSYT